MHRPSLLHVPRHEQDQVLQLIVLILPFDLNGLADGLQSLLIVLQLLPMIEQKGSVVVPVSRGRSPHLRHFLEVLERVIEIGSLLILFGLKQLNLPLALNQLLLL